VIAKRRANPDQYNDVISTLLHTPCKDGTFIPEEQIINVFLGLLFAGHETTAGQAAWTLALLLQHPEHLAVVNQEIAAAVPVRGEPISHQAMSKLEYTYWAIDETTRFRPSADTQLRTVSTPIQVGEYNISTGWRLMVNSINSHNSSSEFTNPDVFDPSRYSPDRKEGKNPFTIVGFGGGMHKCTGMNFAKNEIAIITAKFFQHFDVELLSNDIRVISGKGANRASAVRVRYTRKA
jgi:sterol 14-demethylase